MKKKVLSIMLAVVMVCSLAACGNDPKESTPDTSSTETETESAPETEQADTEETPTEEAEAETSADVSFAIVANNSVGDKGFCDLSNEGIEKAAADFGIEYKIFSCNNDSTIYLDTIKTAAENYDVVFLVTGYFFDDELKEVQAMYPDTKYIYIDGETEQEGAVSVTYMQNEGAFLAGYLAALISETGKVGFVGGVDWPVIHDYEVGFKAGAEYAQNDVEVVSRYTNDHFDAALGKTTAKACYDDGCDVIFQAAGPAGLGVLEAAEENGFLAIGVDTDQGYMQPGHIVSSMLKRVDTSIYDIIEKCKDGEELETAYVYNVANGGISLADNEYYQELVSEENRGKVEELVTAITNGEVTIPSYYD